MSGTALRAFLLKQWQEWPQLTFSIKAVVGQDQRVALEWRSQGTHATGRSLSVEGVTVLQWVGDHLATARTYYDAGAYL